MSQGFYQVYQIIVDSVQSSLFSPLRQHVFRMSMQHFRKCFETIGHGFQRTLLAAGVEHLLGGNHKREANRQSSIEMHSKLRKSNTLLSCLPSIYHGFRH